MIKQTVKPTINRNTCGFSLIELMIVVAIIGILAAIVYPSYSSYVQRASREEAWTNLLKIVDRQERYFLQNNNYANTTQLAYVATEGTPNYSYSIEDLVTDAGSSGAFTAVATVITGSPQAGDADCQYISIDSNGVQMGGTGADTAVRDNCW